MPGSQGHTEKSVQMMPWRNCESDRMMPKMHQTIGGVLSKRKKKKKRRKKKKKKNRGCGTITGTL